MFISMCLYLEFQAVLASQVPQYLPYFLEVQQAHVLLAQEGQLVLVCLKALVDLENHGLPPHQGMDTRKVDRKLSGTLKHHTVPHSKG